MNNSMLHGFKKGFPNEIELERSHRTFSYDNNKKGKEKIRAYGLLYETTVIGEGKHARYRQRLNPELLTLDLENKNITFTEEAAKIIIKMREEYGKQ